MKGNIKMRNNFLQIVNCSCPFSNLLFLSAFPESFCLNGLILTTIIQNTNNWPNIQIIYFSLPKFSQTLLVQACFQT